jgi:hypothetical protein
VLLKKDKKKNAPKETKIRPSPTRFEMPVNKPALKDLALL